MQKGGGTSMYEEAEVISDPSIPGALPTTWRPIPFVSLTFFFYPVLSSVKEGEREGEKENSTSIVVYTPWQ